MPILKLEQKIPLLEEITEVPAGCNEYDISRGLKLSKF